MRYTAAASVIVYEFVEGLWVKFYDFIIFCFFLIEKKMEKKQDFLEWKSMIGFAFRGIRGEIILGQLIWS